MSVKALLARRDEQAMLTRGEQMMSFCREAYPVQRSLTGKGVRTTLGMLGDRWLSQGDGVFAVHEVPTGTPVLDWQVPKEWNVREAWIKSPDGSVIVDVRDHNLHVLGYSVPVDATMPLSELEEHLFSLPDQPELIPYRTSYYAERWGFCLPHEQRQALPSGDYQVFIDSALEAGSLTYGEFFLPGRAEQEVLFSTHCCHPSLANDNLSGLAVMASLASELASLDQDQRRYGYRFLFVPGTLGAITWLARNPKAIDRVVHGLVAANLGDGGGFHYKKSRGGSLGSLAGGAGWPIDRAVVQAGEDLGVQLAIEDFVPFGYDERQYCSPGFNLPIGSLSRTPWGQYPEYHTSADNLDLLRAEQLVGSLQMFLAVCAQLESTRLYRATQDKGEPQLGRRGLYRTIGGDDRGRERELALLWVLSLSDGRRSMEEIADRANVEVGVIREAVEALLKAELLEQV